MAAAAEASHDLELRHSSIGLADVLFQSITYMAPGTGLVFAIGVGIPFVGNALPLSVIVALVACTLAGGDRPAGEAHPVRRRHLHLCGSRAQPEVRAS